MQDNELFNLCKEVYEKTKWGMTDGDDGLSWWESNSLVILPQFVTPLNSICPLYTSDYLLEKLPKDIKSKEYPGKKADLYVRKSGKTIYHAWYFVTSDRIRSKLSDFGEYADTPLKALLKLCLALKEAGEI